MLNLERLTYLLLTQSLPDYEIVPGLDVDAIEHFPLVTFNITGGESLDSAGGKPTGWDAVLDISVFDDDMDDAIDVAAAVYDAVWSWDDPWKSAGTVDDVGRAAEIDDQTIFTRVGTVQIGAIAVTQLAGSFRLQLHLP